eukprot:3961231-Lingulodinium_polyedra.AAC.1
MATTMCPRVRMHGDNAAFMVAVAPLHHHGACTWPGTHAQTREYLHCAMGRARRKNPRAEPYARNKSQWVGCATLLLAMNNMVTSD